LGECAFGAQIRKCFHGCPSYGRTQRALTVAAQGLTNDWLGAGFGYQGLIGFQPCAASTGHVEGRITLHFQVWGGTCRPATGATDDVIIGVWVELVDA